MSEEIPERCSKDWFLAPMICVSIEERGEPAPPLEILHNLTGEQIQ